MIFDYLTAFFFIGVGSFLQSIGIVNLGSIPVFGSLIRSTLVQMVSYYHGLVGTFPYATAGFVAFGMILAFEASLLVLRFFLGHRTPLNSNH